MSTGLIKSIKTFLLILLCITTFASGSNSEVSGHRQEMDGYPPPSVPTLSEINPARIIDTIFTIFLPFTQRGWEYPDIIAPIHSYSLYIKSIDNSEMVNAGCEQGTRDRELAGTQNSIVFLDFGRPNDFGNGLYGTVLFETYTHVTTHEIANAVYQYASGYYRCTGFDTSSHVVIAIGTNNDSDYDVTYEHGAAWAEMVVEADNLLTESIKNQVSLVAASNMELEFDDPASTTAWVNGYDENSQYPFRLYNVGNASGCPPYGSCGDPYDPEDWTQDDVWYISYGCRKCYPLPMIYSNNWANAEQWQHIAKYADEVKGQECMSFRGVVTQYFACTQRPEDETCRDLDNTPEQGYKQLYEVLTEDPITACCADYLDWSTDMKWRGE